LVGIGLAAIAILATVYAGYSYVTNLQKENAQLEKDKLSLTIANSGLVEQVKQEKSIKQDLITENTRAQKSELEARAAISTLEKRAADKERLAREESIEASNKASLYLKFVQNYEKCVAENFDNFNVKCDFLGRAKPIKEEKK